MLIATSDERAELRAAPVALADIGDNRDGKAARSGPPRHRGAGRARGTIVLRWLEVSGVRMPVPDELDQRAALERTRASPIGNLSSSGLRFAFGPAPMTS